MIYLSCDQDIFMKCGACSQAKRVQLLVMGDQDQPEYVIPICDECRADLARQAALPTNTRRPPGGKVLRAKFGRP